MNNSKEVLEDGVAAVDNNRMLNNSKNHAASHIEPAAPQLLAEAEKARIDGAQSMQEINSSGIHANKLVGDEPLPEADSEILLNVPNEPSAGQVGVQGTRQGREPRRARP